MQTNRRTMLVLAFAALAVPMIAGAQEDAALGAQNLALLEVRANRAQVIEATMERMQGQFGKDNPALNISSGEGELRAALHAASPEALLAARDRGTLQEVMAALGAAPWKGPSLIALGADGVVPNAIGETGADLVFTPITPCRIIDTRNATGALLGTIPANTGKHFQVNLASFTPQGGAAAGCPGMPTTFDVAAVAVNVTSTGQSGLGNIAITDSGGATPTVSLLNYTPGVNLANAAIIKSAIGSGLGDIFIKSNNSASHVIVDLMGYFAAPAATALDCRTEVVDVNLPAGIGQSATATASCLSGYVPTGGGAHVQVSGNVIIINKIDIRPSSVFCRITNNTATTLTPSAQCQARCCRVPGR